MENRQLEKMKEITDDPKKAVMESPVMTIIDFIRVEKNKKELTKTNK